MLKKHEDTIYQIVRNQKLTYQEMAAQIAAHFVFWDDELDDDDSSPTYNTYLQIYKWVD